MRHKSVRGVLEPAITSNQPHVMACGEQGFTRAPLCIMCDPAKGWECYHMVHVVVHYIDHVCYNHLDFCVNPLT